MQRISLFKTKVFWKLWLSYFILLVVVFAVAAYILFEFPALAEHQIIIFAIVSALFVSALGIYMARKLMIPLQDIMNVSNAMRRGDYSKRVQVIPNDEIGRIGDTLNKINEEINHNNLQMSKLEGMRKNFVANVSHEIKTPLTSIKGYAETLQEGAIEDVENRGKFLGKIITNSDRLMSLSLIHISEPTRPY